MIQLYHLLDLSADNSLSTDCVSYNCTGGGMTEEEGGDSSGMEPTGDDMEPTNDGANR